MDEIPSSKPKIRLGQVIKRGEFFYGHPGGAGNVGDVTSPLQHPPVYDYNQPDRNSANYNDHAHTFFTIGSGVLMLADSPDKQSAAEFNVNGRVLALENIKLSELSKVRLLVSEESRYGPAIGVVADEKTNERNIVSSHVHIVPVNNKDYIADYDRPKKDFLNKTIYDYHFNPETYIMPQYEVEKGAIVIDLSNLGKDDLKKSLQDLRNGILPEGIKHPENESALTPFVVIRKGIDGRRLEGSNHRETDGDWVVESYVKYKGKYEAVTSATYENGFNDGMPKPEVIKRTYGTNTLTHEQVANMSKSEKAAYIEGFNLPTERVLQTKQELLQFIEETKNLTPKEIEEKIHAEKSNNMATSYLLYDNSGSNKDRFKNFKELSTLNHAVDILVNNEVIIPKNYSSPDIADFISGKDKPKEIDKYEQEYINLLLKTARFSPDTKIEISGKGEAQEIKLNLHDEAYKFDKQKGSFIKE
jgi:hypothetical protein